MKLLLTSAGVKNPSIHNALLELLGKPTAECNALCITTASYGHPMAGPGRAWNFISGVGSSTPMVELGWKSVGVLELSAFSSLGKERWLPWLQEADVLLVNGGDALFLSYWMRESGLAEVLPMLDLVYVGLSAGSMVMTPSVGSQFVQWTPPTGGDETLGLVDFSIFPHLDYPGWPDNSMAGAEQWAASMPVHSYAINDETAIKVTDDGVEVISEGHWKHFPR
jgi:dipeptidase E